MPYRPVDLSSDDTGRGDREPRNLADASRRTERLMDQTGGIAGAINRAVQSATRPAAEVAALKARAEKAKGR